MIGRSLAGLVFLYSFALAAAPDGAAVYKERCAVCHDNATKDARVPARDVLAKLTPENIETALTSGVMKEEGSALSADQKRAVASFLGAKPRDASIQPSAPANLCTSTPPLAIRAQDWNGWGRDLANTRYQPGPGLSSDDVPKLKLKWAFAYPAPYTFGQPAIVGGRIFVTSATGTIYSLDAKSGCTYWTAESVRAGARTAVTVGPMPRASKSRFAAYFGDESATVRAVDAETGQAIWQTKVEDLPVARITGAPTLYKDRLYVPVSSIAEAVATNAKYECCKFRGSVVALDASTGKLLWKSFSIPDPPKPFKTNSSGTQMYGPAGAAIWSSPTIDTKRKLIYVGTGNSYTDVETTTANAILAFDLDTGSLKWSNQVTPKDNFLVGCFAPGLGNCPKEPGPDVDFGSSPILRKLPNGKDVILAGQKSGVVYALDPDNRGKILWQQKVGHGSALGGVEWGFTADEKQVYVPIADAIVPKDGKPGVSALKMDSGEVVWTQPAPAPICSWGKGRCMVGQSQAISAIPGIVFSGAMDGHLRAYSTKDGSIVWDYDTGVAFDTVNGVKGKGGSLDTGGPTIADGMLYVHSGYGRIIGQQGNVLLAFSVEGK
jgi:polyvinyl alcohol dehydrogenase (cytochrome)